MITRGWWRARLPLLPCLLLAGGCYTELEGRPRPARDASRRYAAEQTAKAKEEARQRDEERSVAKAKREADAEAARHSSATTASETATASARLAHEPRAEGATFVAGGQRQTCAARADRVVCWGRTGAKPPEIAVTSLAVGYPNACAIDGQAHVRCWGDNLYGALGDGTIDVRAESVEVVGLTDVESLGVGFFAACAVRRSGDVLCWGHNARGALGDGTETTHRTPTLVVGLPPATEARGGEEFFCARTRAGEIYCWGDGRLGQGGDGKASAKAEKRLPTKVPGLVDIVSLAAGRHHLCAADARGLVRCWGLGSSGVLGPGNNTASHVPLPVPDLDEVVEVAASETQTCARRRNGEVWCWGQTPIPQVEKGLSVVRAARPVPGLVDAVQIAVGEGSVCARSRTGDVRCVTR
jgi:alpha-tubulin suppressor-like RCC1 family protein